MPKTPRGNSALRNAAIGISAAALAATAAACSSSTPASSSAGTAGGQSRVKISFQLNYQAGGPNAGFAVAVAEGYYQAAGLDVTLIQGNGSSLATELVGEGHAPLGYADAVAASQVIAKGSPVKVVSTIYQANPDAVSVKASSGITSVAQLKGKSIAAPSGLAGTLLFPLVLSAAGLSPSDVKIVDVSPTSLVPTLLRGQVDAILSGVDSYAVQAELQGAQVTNLPFADNGAPTVSTSIIANNSYLSAHGAVVTKFIQASARGWAFAIKNPGKAVADLHKVFPQMQESTKQATLELQGAISANLFCADGAKYLGMAEPAEWTKTQQQSGQVGLLKAGANPTEYYTNQYLPAPAQLPACPVS